MKPAAAMRQWRRVDPLVLLVTLAALVLYLSHGLNGTLKRDLAVYTYAGQQVLDGVPPYVGILNRAGPLAHLIPAAGIGAARIVDVDDVLGVRLFFLFIAAACVGVTYLLGKDLFRSKLVGLVAAGAMISFSGFTQFAAYGPREKTPMVLFLLCALLAVVHQRWLAAGVCVSLATLTWQPAFFVGFTAAAVAVLALKPGERLRALVRVVVGGLVPAVVFVVYFAVVGALSEFIDAFLLINARYTKDAPFLAHLERNWRSLQDGYGLSVWVLMAGLVGLAVLTFAALPRRNRRDPSAITLAAIGAASFVGVFWTSRSFNRWPDVYVLLPFAAIGVAAVAKQVFDRLPAKAVLALTLVWLLGTSAFALHYTLSERGRGLVRQRNSVEAKLALLPRGAEILSIQAPQPLVLSGKTNPTRYQMFALGLNDYVDDTYPGGLRGYGDWIERRQPTVIAIDSKRPPRWVKDTIAADYVLVGRPPGWYWYVHKSVGDDVIQQLLPPNRRAEAGG